MAGKDPKKLREQAKKLLAEADKIESGRAIKIGKLVLKYQESGFESFDLRTFRDELSRI